MKIEPGTRIGPYLISDLLGAGGMGDVYRAHDERLRRDVAVKLMSEEGSGDAARMRQMQQEARAASQLSHPNILAVFDVGTHGERMYVVTELLEGESLREVVRRGPVPWRRALGLAVQLAEGLAVAHERGIIHRDIKPDNVFLTGDGRIKILDFGVAAWRAPEGNGAQGAAQTLSQEGLLIGTVGYMSPEQARGQTVDHRSDLFAFGCLLHELLSGRETFAGATPMEVLVAIQRDAPPPLQDLVPNLPADVVRVVDRCLEKDPTRRFQSARDLLFALTLIPTSGVSLDRAPVPVPVPAIGAPATGRRRAGPRLRGALWAGLALLLGGSATLALRPAFVAAPEPPAFHQLTFRRGTVYTARFTIDGAGIVYSAAWDGEPRDLFATVPGTRDSRSLAQAETDVTYLLGSGEISVIRRSRRGFSSGVLGRMSLAGGPPKGLLDGINWADGSPDGAELVVLRRVKGRSVLELPPGHVLLEAEALSYPRLSPDRAHVAFLEHPDPEEDAGKLVVIDRSGKRVLESEGWKSIEGLAWRSDTEIWFTASKEGRSLWMQALDLKGKTRLLSRVPGRLVLHDLSADGRVVAERNSYRATLMMGTGAGPGPGPETRERDISWQDFSQLGQLSRDGKQVLFSEQGEGAGAGITAYLRPVEGGAPLRLGEGLALALSPDGTKALLRVEDKGMHLEVVPIGAGRSERLPRGSVTTLSWAAFVPGSPRLVMLAREAGKGDRLYLQELTGGSPVPLAAEGVEVVGDAVSPDGSVVAGSQNGRGVLIPLDGGAPRELPGLTAEHLPIGWTSDGRTLFVRNRASPPMVIHRYELATGKLEPWRSLAPPDPAGVLSLGHVSVARDGEVYVYESYRLLSDLYVIENLR